MLSACSICWPGPALPRVGFRVGPWVAGGWPVGGWSGCELSSGLAVEHVVPQHVPCLVVRPVGGQPQGGSALGAGEPYVSSSGETSGRYGCTA